MPIKGVGSRDKKLGEICHYRNQLFLTRRAGCDNCFFSTNAGCGTASCSAHVPESEGQFERRGVPCCFVRLSKRRRRLE